MTNSNDTECDVSYEELSALTLGDLDDARSAAVKEHVSTCDYCRRRLRALEALDATLGRLRAVEPPPSAVLHARRSIAQLVRGPGAREIMTLPEVADFLRVSTEELEGVASELPAFELGGQVRVRRSKLIEWIEQRERVYARSAIQSEVAGIIAGVD